MTTQGTLKRGRRVIYTFAGGKQVPGKILGRYSGDAPKWYRAELTDEVSTWRCGCHIQQLRVVDNGHARKAR